MRGFGRTQHRRAKAGKVAIAALLGSALGAVVTMLMNPARRNTLIRRITGGAMGINGSYERTRTAEGNLQDQMRGLSGQVQGTPPSTEARGI